MNEHDLTAAWTVLETEGLGPGSMHVAPAGILLSAGEALAGVDGSGDRHLLIPLRDGEAFAEDRSSTGVQLVRVDHGAEHYLSVVCRRRELDRVFSRFCRELLESLAGSTTSARPTVEALSAWRRLFEPARHEDLSDSKLVGLLGELLVLEKIVERDPERRLGTWTGPTGSQHDFRAGSAALEVKSTTAREGRIVTISSIDQLVTPDDGSLHLVHHRFDPDPSGESLPDLVERILDCSVEQTTLLGLLRGVGYSATHADRYRNRRFRLVDTRYYDVDGTGFPKIVPSSFKGDVQPAGTQRISYAIDLGNEPPHRLPDAEASALIDQFALCP